MNRPLLTLVALFLAHAASAQGVKFGDDFAAAQDAAKMDKKLVLLYLVAKDSGDCKKMDGDFESNSKLAETLGRKFTAAKLMAEIPANKATFKRFDANKPPAFVVLDSDGRILDRVEGYQEPTRFTAWIDGMIELQAGLAMLEKADKTKPTAMVAALRKIGSVATERSYTVLVDVVDNEELPETVRKAAIEGLGKQKFGPEKLLVFLTHRNATLKSAATSAIKQQGSAAAGAMVEGIASDNADQRVICWSLLTALNKDPKQVRDAAFWRNGKPADRETAVATLREWLKGAK
jgi:thioredoxin-related protein